MFTVCFYVYAVDIVSSCNVEWPAFCITWNMSQIDSWLSIKHLLLLLLLLLFSMWGKIWFQCTSYDYTVYMDYMDLTVWCLTKAIKFNHSITHPKMYVSMWHMHCECKHIWCEHMHHCSHTVPVGVWLPEPAQDRGSKQETLNDDLYHTTSRSTAIFGVQGACHILF